MCFDTLELRHAKRDGERTTEGEREREIKTNPTQRAEQEICAIVDETIFRGTRKTSKREHYHRVFS